MLKIVNFHLGLIKYLANELKKKRTPKELVLFLKQTVKAYLRGLIDLYKRFLKHFDKDYRKELKKYEKLQQARKDLNNAYKLLQYMVKKEGNRHERRSAFFDFVKHGRLTKEFEAEILKEVYNVESEKSKEKKQ